MIASGFNQLRLKMADESELASAFREMIKHENDLVNHRLGWLMHGQTLLFGALAFAWEKAPMPLKLLFPVLGIALALSVWRAMVASRKALEELRTEWQRCRPKDAIDVIVIGFCRKSSTDFLFPWRIMPIIFASAWSSVAVIWWFSGK
jgi:hypothetical protein